MHDSVRKRSTADLVVTVKRLPKGVRSPAPVRIMFAVDELGRPGACVPEISVGIPKTNLQLAPLACEQLVRSYKAVAAQDATGKPVPSVQTGSVEFRLER